MAKLNEYLTVGAAAEFLCVSKDTLRRWDHTAIFRARLLDSSMRPRIISWWGNSFGAEWFQKIGKQTTNLASINLTVLRSFPVPLAPIDEQAAIVEAVENAMSLVGAADTAVQNSRSRATRLRQSILRDAFEGKLVAQDPLDEPASMLLERIRRDREQQPSSSAAKRRSRKKHEVEVSKS